MSIFGKLVSNVKEFYRDINSATLTGAIDVVIIQQADGSYVSSPFHVRFGKLGVLRSREKVVDIEVNDQPVDLHMKLGEAGEAFFVREAEEESEVPPHLATSPLPDAALLMEEGIMQLHEELFKEEEGSTCDTITTPEGLWEPRHCGDADSDTSKEVAALTPDENMPSSTAVTRDTSMKSLYFSSDDITSAESTRKASLDIAIQTDLSGNEVESKTNYCIRVISPPPSDISENKTDNKSGMPVTCMPSGETNAMQLADSQCATNPPAKKKCKPHTTLISGETDRNKDSSSDGSCNKCSLAADVSKMSGTKSKRRRRKKFNSKPVKQTVESAVAGETMSSDIVSTEMLDDNDEGVFQLELSEDDVAMGQLDECDCHTAVASTTTLTDLRRNDSQPTIEEKLRLTDEWADSQFASGLHPFSDGDITPVMSPVGSRPPSPKSDTEYETQKYDDAISQTQLTGDDLRPADNYRWEWGELPETNSSVQQLTPQKGIAKEEQDVKPEKFEGKGGSDRASSGLFHFMRKTKKLRHQPQLEGIYLDDLNLNEMDPEVAALYLYHPKNGPMSVQQLKDEDSESGTGASLPHSPETVQHKDPQLDVTCPTVQKQLTSASDVAMSLCGGLVESGGEISTEKFLQFLITYDDFSEKPSILNDPNLVVRIDGRFFNWNIAGPVIMSMLAYERPLPEAIVDSLTKLHMPKKERRRGWFSWGRTPPAPQENSSTLPQEGSTADSPQPGTSADKKEDDDSTTCSPASSPPSSPRKGTDKAGSPRDDGFQSEDDSETLVTGMASEHTQTSLEKYKKCLKLTTEQILRLKLKEGVNDVSFSVTTQYQGTTRCTSSIFLWRWDDRVIVSDIDGTITRSDVLGQVLPMIGKDWSQAGIAKLYSMVSRNGYKFLYLSARAIGQAKTTRDYLRSVCQTGNISLPDGPLLLSPSSLISAFHKEVIERKPEEFKISCLRDIQALFPPSRNPFYAGFGNKINDVWAYRAVGIPISRVFTVNYKGELKLELIQAHHSSYTKLSDIVDHVFPPLLDRVDKNNGKIASGNFPLPDEYSPFTYWREPLPDIAMDELDVFLGRSPEVAASTEKK